MFEDKTYESLLTAALNDIGDGVQKGEGYLVFNALSALAYELEKLYTQLDYVVNQGHADTADMDSLILIAADRGLIRKKATHAKVRINTNCEVPIGSRFSLKSCHYAIESLLSHDESSGAYSYMAACEETGSTANSISGELTAIDYIEGLESAAITEILIEGEDDETRDELYKRYLESFTVSAFGGNIAQYKQRIKEIDGVGGCKIYPVWNGPGTVKAVVISSGFGECSETLIEQIKEAAVPSEGGTGYGFAPIDHTITVESVKAVKINVDTSLTFKAGITWNTVRDAVTDKIKSYLSGIASAWEDGDEKTEPVVYVSRLEAAVLDIDGIQDIQYTKLNDKAENMTLSWDEIPVIGEVKSE